MLVGDLLLYLLPFHTKGRVGEHKVKADVGQLVIGQGVAQLNVADVLALDQHVRLTNGVGLRVELLAVQGDRYLVADRLDVFNTLGQKATGARCGVIDGDDAVRLELGVLASDHQRGGQVNDVSLGEVFTSRLVRAFSKLADQLFEDAAHAEVSDPCRAQINAGEALYHLIEQIGGRQLLNEVFKLEVLEDLARILTEGLHIAHQVRGSLGIRQGAHA